MKRIAIAIGLLAAVCGVTAVTTAKDKETDLWLKASVSIDAQGRVTGLDWNNVQTPVYTLLAERVAPAVKAWEFVPATVDGQPTTTRTGLLIHVFVSALPDGDLKLRFGSAQTGPMAISLTPPRYPHAAAKAGVSALVTTLVQVTADGKPIINDLKVVSDGGNRDAFEKASREAIANWTFRPEIVAGRAVPGTIRIPISYCMGGAACKRFEAADTKPAADAPADTYIASSTAVALKTNIGAQAI